LLNLASPFDEKSFESFIRDFFPDFIPDRRTVPKQGEVFPSITYLGESEKLRTSVLVVTTTLGINSRISLTKASFKILKNFGIYRALVVYLNPDQTIWRLSLLTAQPIWSDGKIIQSFSNPERHSYVLGSDVGVATARKYLMSMGNVSDFDDLKFRFSLEAINKEFYNDITKYFYELTGTYSSEGKQIKVPLLRLPGNPTHIENQEYAVRLFGRIIFCWFLREKKSTNHIQLLPSEVFDGVLEKAESIHTEILEPLFFECFNKPLAERNAKFKNGEYALVPYLNGGLFHPNEGSGGDYFPVSKGTKGVTIPNEWFINLFQTLKTYNFTMDENLDFDVELSIDPEMLGRIFENLLAEINPETGASARKTTGSFYTPRRMVSHMTDMSLTQYLLNETNVSEEQIKALMTINTIDDLEHPLNNVDKLQISEKLYSLKSLDPACGSGAFTIGLLQKIVFLLEQVDSDFEVTKKLFDKTFFKGKKHLEGNKDYLRKLVLIRDVIHGVDIQPVAVEISKLRCFLTLIVEQDVIDDLENRGLEPLPNLDFQFVCANSLIGLNAEKQMMFDDDSHLEEELTLIREEFYSTNSGKRRESLKTKYLKLVNEELTLFGESSRTSQLKTFQPFVVNNVASFFDPKNMFGISKFNIVIANPPYVRFQNLGKEQSKLLSENYFEKRDGKIRGWFDDLYVHFIFRAFDLASDNGIICMITNDSFVGLESKSRVREKLLHENIIELIRCPIETFGATIYTAIFLASRSSLRSEFYTSSRFTYPDFEITDVAKIKKDYVRQLPHTRFVYAEDNLMAKLSKHTKLESFLKVDPSGINSGNVRPKMFFLEKNTEATERLIQGRQVQRWAVYWDSPSAKYKYCNPNYVPQDNFGTGRGGKGMSLKKEYWFYNRGDAALHFAPERILMRETSDCLLAAYQEIDKDGQLYTDHTVYSIVLKNESLQLKYFLGILNSRLLNYYYQNLTLEQGKVFAAVKIHVVNQLPIVYSEDRAMELIDLVETLVNMRRENPTCDVSVIEEELDNLVCEIYELSQDEKNQVLKSK
jgi:hypothetical protein